MKLHRILAVIGLVLILGSIVTMMIGLFAGAAKVLLLNISLLTFLGAVTILLTLGALRKRAEQSADPSEEE